MRNDVFYPLSVPNINGKEWEYIRECLDSEWVSTAGAFVEKFEQDFAEYVGSRFAIACSNGTAALQVALQCAGVKPDDEVIIPSLTFIATPNAATYLGAHPVFLDSDPYYNLSSGSVSDFLANNAEIRGDSTINIHTGRRIKAICPVHVFGNAVDLTALQLAIEGYNITIVEDAAESLGTHYTGGPLAGRHTGTVGLLGAFSFNGNKIITTGGGGMIVTDDEKLARRAKHLTTTAKEDEVRFVHDEIGYNFRLTNIQAAMGVAQLEQLPDFLATKRRNFELYQQLVSQKTGLTLAPSPQYATNNHWMYPLQIDSEMYGKTREELMALLQENRIQTRPVWQLSHLQKPYLGNQHSAVPNAERLLASTLCLPCSTNLSDSDIEHIAGKL